MLVLVLLAAAAAYPTPPERTPEQIQHMVDVKARAQAASAAATPEVDRYPITTVVRNRCCPSWTPQSFALCCGTAALRFRRCLPKSC